MVADQRLELADDAPIQPRPQIGLDAILHRLEPQLAEAADLAVEDGAIGEIGVRHAVPQVQRRAQQLGRGRRIVAEDGPPLGAEPLEAENVEPFRIDANHIAATFSQRLSLQHLAQLGHVAVQRVPRRGQRTLAPYAVNQPVDRDHPVGADEQHREHHPLLRATEGEGPTVGRSRQRPQGAVLDHPSEPNPSDLRPPPRRPTAAIRTREIYQMNSQFRKLCGLQLSVGAVACLAAVLPNNAAAAEAGGTTTAIESGGTRCRGRDCGSDLAETDRIEDVDTIVIVAMPDDFPVGSVMRAQCAFVQRVEFPDGAARETQQCTLTNEPVMIPENQGSPPEAAFRHHTGPCEWVSDYWYAKNGTTVYASTSRLTVTPAGNVYVTSTYPAEPLDCE
jgi:hypothetical protein